MWITGFHTEVCIPFWKRFQFASTCAGSFLAVEGELGSKCGPLQAAKDDEEMEEVVASSAVGVVWFNWVAIFTLKEEQRAALQSDLFISADQDTFTLLLSTYGNTSVQHCSVLPPATSQWHRSGVALPPNRKPGSLSILAGCWGKWLLWALCSLDALKISSSSWKKKKEEVFFKKNFVHS